MRRARILPALFLTLAVAGGCRTTNRCKSGTLLVTVLFEGSAASATTIDTQVSVDGGAPKSQSLDHQSGMREGSIEIFFPAGYPTGRDVQVTLTARAGAGASWTATAESRSLAGGCDALRLTLGAADADAGRDADALGDAGGVVDGGGDRPETGGGGGVTGTGGGVAGTGGVSGTGGVTGAGGETGTGGQDGTGGETGTGGQDGTGGETGTGGQDGTGGAAPDCTTTHLVISEIRSRGASSATDEFIELYNPTNDVLGLDSTWTIDARTPMATIYTVRWTGSSLFVPAHGHFLIAGAGYIGNPPADAALPGGISDESSVRLLHAGAVVDAVCYAYSPQSMATFSGDASFTCEGTPVVNPHDNAADTNVDASIERSPGGSLGNCSDTDDNAADFATRTPAFPESSQSIPVP